jgi:exosortase F-associated protein
MISKEKRIVLGLIGLLGLIGVYVFQYQIFYDPLNGLPLTSKGLPDNFNAGLFAWQKLIRYLLNDGFAMLLLFALFPEKKYMRFAMLVILLGLIFLLPLYLILFTFFPETTYSYLNHLHRIVMNPVLMMLLIPAFYYQKRIAQSDGQDE